MARYFLEVAYKGTHYSGFQIQQNANTVQAEIEKAIRVIQREVVVLTGSSRTDAGVHALQNYFHFDFAGVVDKRFIYQINSVLPADIAVRRCVEMSAECHSRFDAVSREYRYYIYRKKDPFLQDRAFYFPYKLNLGLLQEGAMIVKGCRDFRAFSKQRTQAKTFICDVLESEWKVEEEYLVYEVRANRFLRGMVRALVATLLKLGREKITMQEFRSIIESGDATTANFASPAHGLFLVRVNYPGDYFKV